MKKVRNVVCVCIIAVVIICVCISHVLISKSVSNIGTFTNEDTKKIYSGIEGYKKCSVSESNITFFYPDYCEIIQRDSGDMDVLNSNKSVDEYIVINIDTNIVGTYPFYPICFRRLPYTFVKYTYKFEPIREDIASSFYKLENINNSWTMVFYEEILSDDGTSIFSCKYYYVNKEKMINSISVLTTDINILQSILGTVIY